MDVFQVFTFASLVGVLVGIPSSAVGLRICALATGIRKHKSIIKKKSKTHDNMMLLPKT